jgi:hypothetical protein
MQVSRRGSLRQHARQRDNESDDAEHQVLVDDSSAAERGGVDVKHGSAARGAGRHDILRDRRDLS